MNKNIVLELMERHKIEIKPANMEIKEQLQETEEKTNDNPENDEKEEENQQSEETDEESSEDDEQAADKEDDESMDRAEIEREIDELYEEINFDYKCENQEQITLKMVAIIRRIAKGYTGLSKNCGFERYDENKIAKHLVSYRKDLIIKDKYTKNDSRVVEIYIDTSMSMYMYKNAIKESVILLEKQGYTCVIRSCDNGFCNTYDLEKDDYEIRQMLEDIGVGVIPEICRPCEKRAIENCNNADFSIVIADFDGLSSIVRVARGCNKDKVPYLISTESRYSFKNPTEHIWVEKKYSTYDMSKVFDVSIKQEYNLIK